MLGSLSSQSSAMADMYRRLLQRSATEGSKTDDRKTDDRKTDEQKTAEQKAAERKAAEKQAADRKAAAGNQANEARNYLDDQGNPTNALTAVSKAASGGDEERKAQLKEKLRMLVEQLKSLLQFAMRNPAMAKALAQLSREIASVAKQLGTSGPAVNVSAAQAAPAQAAPAQGAAAQAAAGAQAAGAQAAASQADTARAATTQAATTQAANEGAEAAQGAEAAAQPQAATATTGTAQQGQGATGEKGTGEKGTGETAGGVKATGETGKAKETGAEKAEDGEADETGETEGLGSAETAAAHGQAILEKVKADRPKDESDPELKALLTLAKALTRQAKAVIEDMARDAQRAGKNDDFKEELKDASEAVKEIQKLDTGASAEGASAGAIVSLIA